MNLEDKCKNLLKRSLNPIPQELDEIDWKVTLSYKKDRLKKHLSAFANLSGGGFLIFGVDDNGKVVGVEDEESRQFADLLANIARSGLEPEAKIHFITFTYEGKNLLGVYIEESFERPVHIKNRGIDRSYIRAGGQTRPMSKEDVRYAVLSSRSIRFEEVIASLTQDVSNSFKEYFDFSEIMKRTRPSGFTELTSMHEYLNSLKLFVKVQEAYLPSNLAVIVAAKDFRNFQTYEKFAVRLIEYSGNTRINARRDITFNKGYSLTLDKILETLISWLPTEEKIEYATQTTTPMIPVVVLRELIANAIIHQDLKIKNSCVLIELFSDRLEITNPGGLVSGVSVDRLIDHPSCARNEVLISLMRKLGHAEERGSGIDKSIIAMERAGLSPITFINGGDYFQVVIPIGKPFSELTHQEKMNAIFQHACLNVVIQRKTTVRSIRERFQLSVADTPRVNKLIEESILLGKIKLVNPHETKNERHYIPYWM